MRTLERVKAKLLVIDPVTAVFSGKDFYKDSEVRKMIAPMHYLIEELHVCCLIVRHLTKTRPDNE